MGMEGRLEEGGGAGVEISGRASAAAAWRRGKMRAGVRGMSRWPGKAADANVGDCRYGAGGRGRQAGGFPTASTKKGQGAHLWRRAGEERDPEAGHDLLGGCDERGRAASALPLVDQ